jgi:hypothetical protein
VGQQKLCAIRGVACMAEGPVKGLDLRNSMRGIFTYGSVGGALGNRCFYPEVDLWHSSVVVFAKLIVYRYFFTLAQFLFVPVSTELNV